MRTPVAANIALVMAGTAGGRDGSPRPVGLKSVVRNFVSTDGGICDIRVG